MRGRSRGVSDPASDAVAWVAARAAPGVAYVPSRFAAIRLGVDALIPLSQPRFEIEGQGLIYRTWPVAFRGQLGVEVRFP